MLTQDYIVMLFIVFHYCLSLLSNHYKFALTLFWNKVSYEKMLNMLIPVFTIYFIYVNNIPIFVLTISSEHLIHSSGSCHLNIYFKPLLD